MPVFGQQTLAVRVASLWVPAPWRSQVVSDLADEARAPGRSRSSLWTMRHMVAIGTRLRARAMARRLPSLDGLLTGFIRADLRAAIRQLWRAPSASIISIITLAVAVSAVVTVYAFLNRTVLHPLAFEDPARLVAVWRMDPASPDAWLAAAPGDFVEWRRDNTSFERLVAGQNISMTFTAFEDGGAPLMRRVSAGWFETLGVVPVLGRPFTADEDVPNGPAVAMLSYDTWQRYYAGRSTVVGESVELDNVAYTIVGVTPEGYFNPVFALVDAPEVFLPLGLRTTGESRATNTLLVAGRLRRDTTLSQAQQELLRISEEQARAHPDTNGQFRATVQPMDEQLVRPLRSPLTLLFIAVLGLFFAACGNVANLQLARTLSRGQEHAVQLALGASRLRLFLQMLAEGATIAALSGAVAVLIVALFGPAVAALMPPGLLMPRLSFALDGQALLAAGLATIVAALLSSLPAMAAVLRRLDGSQLAAGAARSVGSRDRRRWAGALVTIEMAVAVTLLTGAGLALIGFQQLRERPHGFEPADAVTFRVSTRGPEFQAMAARLNFFDRVREELAALPGVDAVGVAGALPIFPQFRQRAAYAADVPIPSGREPRISVFPISEGFLDAFGVPLLSGRPVTQDDQPGSPPVTVLSLSAARALFGPADPVGRQIVLMDGDTPRTINVIGVTGDVRSSSDPTVFGSVAYVSWRQAPTPNAMGFVVRSREAPATLFQQSEQAVHRVNRSMPLYVPRTLAQVAASLEATYRFTAILLGVFAGVGLLLVATGIYGTISNLVSDRWREIGVRMALGATRGRVLELVIREGLRPAVTGIGIGWVGAVAFGQVVARAVSGTPAFSWILFLALPALLLLLGALASLMPALRATRVNPTTALRTDT